MRIVYITESVSDPGGTERVLSVKANYLVEKGYEIFIISQLKNSVENFFWFDERIKQYELDLKTKNKKEFLNKLDILLSEIKPDILISLGLRLTLYAGETKYPCKKILEWHFAKYKSKQYFYQLEKNILTNFYPKFYNSKKNNAIKKYDKFVTLTNEDRIDWGNFDNITTISNPITINVSQHSNLTNNRVIAVGRLEKQKDFKTLIDIWKNVVINYPDWELFIFGEGKQRKQLETYIKKYKLQDNIFLCGNVKNIHEEYLNSSIYVSTSIYEGQALVIIEAMQVGLPIVSFTYKCGPKDVITDKKDGFLIDVGDKKEFENKLTTLMSNLDLRKEMGLNAIEKSKIFQLDNIMHQWENLFKSLR